MHILEAMARMEGFYRRGSRPQRNNNPGDIEYGKFAQAHGATHAEQPAGRFAVFPDAATGFEAMRALLESRGYAGLTVSQALNRWAPPVENDTNAYTANVCRWAECKPDDAITDLLQAPLTGWMPNVTPAARVPQMAVAIGHSLADAGKG